MFLRIELISREQLIYIFMVMLTYALRVQAKRLKIRLKYKFYFKKK